MDDMLSNLPEALLILIISFLPLKDAVMTSVLSKQWLNLWTNTMSIDLNEDQFLETPKQRRLLCSGHKAWALHIKNMGLRRFADFVCQMLPCFEGPKISKFSLRFSYQTEYHYCLEEWIQFAISKKVEEIHLDLSDGDLPPDTTAFFESLFCLPDFLYEYKSLHVLKLDSCKFSPSNFQCFTTLSILYLRRIKLPQEVIEDVITNSPYLISLSLIECFDLYYLRISGLELPLKKLTVRDCMPLSLGIELCAPELQSFEYFGNMVTFYIDNLVSLSNVILHFGLESKFYYYGVELSDLLRDLNHAKSLTVCSYLIQVLPTEEALFNNLPWPLLNLKHLTLMVGLVRHELPGLLCLLRSSPNLETLTIQAGFESFLDDYIFPKCALMPSKYWESLRLTFNHLQSLRMVKMEGFQGDGNELELLKFLLEMAMVLETMKIIPAKHVSSRTDGGASPLIAKAVEELQNSEIASPNVEISFY